MLNVVGCVADAGVFWLFSIGAILCLAAGALAGTMIARRRTSPDRGMDMGVGIDRQAGVEPMPRTVRPAPTGQILRPAGPDASAGDPHVDALTGVATRLLLRDRLDLAVAMADRAETGVAVLWVDLDGFHAVNDQFGRAIGDRLLIEVGKRLRGATRDTDTVARLENDTFIVVQPFAAQPQSAQALSQRLIRSLAEPHVIDGHIVMAPASIGIAFCPTDTNNSEMLLKQADLALRRAKRDGGNGVRFHDDELDASLRARFNMTKDLRQALERGELSMQYQPILDTDRLDTTGFEAMLRWTHPSLGAVEPSVFIPLAEQCGIMPSLGMWALETACADANAWPSARLLTFNLSRTQLRDRDLPARILETLSRHLIAPERLEIEVQEAVLVADQDRALDLLTKLKARGMRIALDGFGTADGSLLTLRRFAFDRVKLARHLIEPLGRDEHAGVTVRALLAMAHALDIDVTAVGVENEQQLALLRTLRCDHVQGFLLARPTASINVSHAPRLAVVAA